MKIGFVINHIPSEKTNYATTHLALTALMRGHDVWYIEIGDFAYDPDELVHAWAHRPARSNYRTAKRFLGDLKSDKFLMERITVDSLDILFLRNNPADDFMTRPWARLAGVNFGRLALRHGVIVLNDPDGLNHAINKKYLQVFPKQVRPRTLISRHAGDIKAFVEDEGGTIVLKPLAGSGGRNVFLVRPDDLPNLNQMIEAVLGDGYAVAQEYLPQAVEGDIRLFLMNGRMLEKEGKVAAIHRFSMRGDMRSNITAGGRIAKPEITDDIRYIAEAVRPRLVEDGMFFVGLDIVGSKILEINVFSPGGLYGAGKLAGVNFIHPVIEALEHKVQCARQEPDHYYSNIELATM